MQKWKCSRESVTFIDKDMYEEYDTHVSQRLTGQAFTLMH